MNRQGHADLHTHSAYSDGTLSPAELVGRALQLQLGAFALTDHDTAAGLDEAEREARRLGVCFIPGIELTATHGQEERHILGYWIDREHGELSALLGRMELERERRIHRIVEKLGRCCSVELEPESVFAVDHRGVLGRLHVAEALLRAGVTRSLQEAFDRFLHDSGPAYVGKFALPVAETIALVHRAGGVAVLAHPGDRLNEVEITAFAESGLDGLEAYYPSHPPARCQEYHRLADRLGLIATGGSDYHGERKLQELAAVTVPLEVVENLNRRRIEPNATARTSR